MKKPHLLIVLDGWGLAPASPSNAVSQAKTPVWSRLVQEHPFTKLEASAGAVGLPDNTIGNSEVGHMNIGAGRVVYQDLTRINKAIADGSFFENKVLKSLQAPLHLIGLLSDAGVHSHINHIFALLDFAKQEKIAPVYVHCFTDGRDSSPTAGKKYMAALEKKIAQTPGAAIASVIGRFYAMDRDKRWERTEEALQALTAGKGEFFASAAEAIDASYAKGVTDEFVKPALICAGNVIHTIKEGDSVLFFNFRADRARQITEVLNKKKLNYVTMTKYQKDFNYPNLFPPQDLNNVFGEVISKKGLQQFRIAETEKYAHVTYFFNGGQETPFAREDRHLIPSPRDVATYDLKPEMSARAVTEEIIRRLRSKKYDVMIINFANPDMVGHTGNIPAVIQAVETVDECLGEVLKEVEAQKGVALVTADHGNAEHMRTEDDKPHTAHTLNLVPLTLFDPSKKDYKFRDLGKLCDLAPTLLQLLNIEQPKEMTGRSLIV